MVRRNVTVAERLAGGVPESRGVLEPLPAGRRAVPALQPGAQRPGAVRRALRVVQPRRRARRRGPAVPGEHPRDAAQPGVQRRRVGRERGGLHDHGDQPGGQPGRGRAVRSLRAGVPQQGEPGPREHPHPARRAVRDGARAANPDARRDEQPAADALARAGDRDGQPGQGAGVRARGGVRPGLRGPVPRSDDRAGVDRAVAAAWAQTATAAGGCRSARAGSCGNSIRRS